MKTNKKSIIISLCLAFVLIAGFFTTPIKALTNTFANTFQEEVGLANGNFDSDDESTSVEDHPNISLPSGWTRANSASYPENAGDITCGIVSAPVESDKKELELSANNNKFGLKHTILTELLADSYYVVSFSVRTNGGATASVYLTENFAYSYEGITTGAESQTHKLYLETKVAEKADLGIELWIGSRETETTGTIYFDNVEITKVSATEYFEATHDVSLLGECFSEKTNITPNTLQLRDTTNLATNGWSIKETENATDLEATLAEENEELPVYSNQYNGSTAPVMDTADSKYKLLTEIYLKDADSKYYFDEEYTKILPDALQTGTISIGTKHYAGKTFFYLDTVNDKIYADYKNEAFTNELPLTLADGLKTTINGTEYTFTLYENDKYYIDTIEVFKNLKDAYYFTKTENEVTFPIIGGGNDRILKLKNINETTTLTYVSPKINIEQFGYYKISFYAKSNIEGGDTTSGLTINYTALLRTGTKPSGEERILTTTATPKEVNLSTNNWTYYAFYVKGSPISSNESNLEFKINSGSTIYISNIESTRISSEAYTASTANNIDLSVNNASASVLEADTIVNGNFNLASAVKFNKETGAINYPLTPASWTPTGSLTGTNSKAGIVPTSDIYTSSNLKTLLGNTDCPADSGNLNILAIYAPSNSTYGYKSDKFEASASTIYQLSFDVYTGTNFAGKIYSKVYSSSATIAEFSEITSTTGWATYTYYIKTSALKPTLYIELGITESTGTAFFKNVEIKTSDDTTYDEKVRTEDETIIPLSTQRTNKYVTVDLEIDNFTAHSYNYSDTTNRLYTPYTFTTNENSTGMVGVLNTEDNLTGTVFEGKTKLNLPTATSNQVLALYNSSNEKHSSISQVFGADMSANKYYKLSIWLKTQSIEEGKGLLISFIENTTEEDATPFKIEFINVNTTGFTDEDSNDYREYSAYIRTGSEAISSMKINVNFGDETTGLSGYCFISEVSFEESSKTEYNNAKKANKLEDTENTKFVDLKTNTTTPATKTEDENIDTLSLFFIVFSSVILVGALIFVIIVIYARKLPKKKRVKASKNIIGKDGENRRKGGFI